MTAQAIEELVDAIATRIVERLTELQQAAPEHGEDSPWMNVKSAAAYLDLPVQRLYRLTARGEIPHYKQDGRLLFHRQELDEWLAQYRQLGDWISSDNRGMCP